MNKYILILIGLLSLSLVYAAADTLVLEFSDGNITFNKTIIDGTKISCSDINVDSGDACNPSGGATPDNASFNQTLTDTLYADIIWGYNQTLATLNLTTASSANNTFNQTLTDTLYADIIWGYNQTLAANNYTEAQGYITGYSESDPDSFHLNQDNWAFGDDYNYIVGSNWYFNQSKLETIYYNYSVASVIRGTPAGNISTINKYDDISYNITEVSGAPGLDFRINFSGVDDLNQILFRYKSSASESHTSFLQLWNYDTNKWENYGTQGLVSDYTIFNFGVYDSAEHISSGIVQLRIYTTDNGNINHIHYFDWITISKGMATPAGTEVDPLSIHKTELNNSQFYYNGNLNLNLTTLLFANKIWNYNQTLATLNITNLLYSNIIWNYNQTLATNNFTVAQGYLTSYTETDPLWSGNSSNVLIWSYNQTEAANAYTDAQGFLTSYTETDPLWSGNSSNVLIWSYNQTEAANAYTDAQGFLTSESDPLWSGNSSNVLIWSYNQTEAANAYTDAQGFLTSESDPVWDSNSTTVLLYAYNQTLVTLNISDNIYWNEDESIISSKPAVFANNITTTGTVNYTWAVEGNSYVLRYSS